MFGEDLFFSFWSSPEFGEKSVPFFFFGLHLICSPEQNHAGGSSPNVENRAKLG